MSTQAIAGTVNAPDLLAASQRVAQLRALLTEAGRGAPTASFAAALAAAGSPGQSATPVQSGTPGQTGTPASAAAGGLATTAMGASTTSPYASLSPVPGTLGSTLSAAGTVTPSNYPTGSPVTPTAAQTTSGGSSQYDSLISQAAARYGLDPAVLHGLIQQESGFNANSRSSAGAAGLTQLMPGTAASLGVSDPLDPAQSIEGGARYLSQMMSQFGGNVTDALAAYNAGPGAVKQYGGVPPYAETQAYVNKVLGYAESYRQSGPANTNTGQIT